MFHPETLKLDLIDGTEASFVLSLRGLHRVMERLGAKTLQDLAAKLQENPILNAPPLLFEAMQNRGAITEEQLMENLPANLRSLTESVTKLLGLSMQDPSRPTQAPDQTGIVQ